MAVLSSLRGGDRLAWWNRLRHHLTPGQNLPPDRACGYLTYRGYAPLKDLDEALGDFRPDIAVADVGKTSRIAEALRARRVPTVAYLRDLEPETFSDHPVTDPQVSFIANSQFTASAYAQHRDLQCQIIRPLVHPEYYRVNSTREVALHINPSPKKGIDITLNLAEARLDIPFLLVETWSLARELREHYRRRAAELPNVRVVPTQRDMRAYYGRTRVVLAPSIWPETWGRIATEAHISGIPVLASTRGGLPESVGPGGTLLDPEAPLEQWVEALGRLWDDRTVYARLSRAALDHADRPEIHPKRVLDDFSGVLEQTRAMATASTPA